MWLRLALVVPSIGHVSIFAVSPNQACAEHSQAVEVGLGQIAYIEAQAFRLAAVFDDELQQDEAFARIAEARARFEMDAQLLVRFDEPEVAEAGGVGQTHTRSNLFPARVVSEVLVWSILVRKNRIGAIARQRTVEIVLNGS